MKVQLPSQVESQAGKTTADETDLHKASADYYERSWRIRRRLRRDDWWIAVAVYSLLVSIAFVVL